MAKKKLTEQEKQRIRDIDAELTGKEGKLLSEKDFFEQLEFLLGTDLKEYPRGVITALRDLPRNTKKGMERLRKRKTKDDNSEKDMMYGSMVTKKKKKKKGMMGGSMVHGGKKKKKNGMMDGGKVYTSSQKKYGGGRVFPMKGKV